MRDPMSWSIPLFRAFGIQVKVHILYIVITLGMLLRSLLRGSGPTWPSSRLIWVVMLFVIVLCTNSATASRPARWTAKRTRS